MTNHQNANETKFSSTTGVVELIQFVNNFRRYFLHLNLFWKAMLLKMYLKLSNKLKEEFMFRDVVSNLKLRQTISLQFF